MSRHLSLFSSLFALSSVCGCYVESGPPPAAQPTVVQQAPPAQPVYVQQAPPAQPVYVQQAPAAEPVTVIEAPPAPPPAPPPEPVPPPPTPEHVWVTGYQRWNGRAYVYERGHYERRPHSRARYVAAHWEPRGRGKVWVDGRWE